MKLQEIKLRRSTRKYTDEIVSQEAITNILEVAQYTPTTMNLQAYKMVVVERGALSEEVIKTLAEGQRHAVIASHNVFIFTMNPESLTLDFLKSKMVGMPAKAIEEYPPMLLKGYRGENKDMSGAAYSIVQSMALEAVANGVGSVIYAGINRKALSEMFKDKVDMDLYQPMLGISFGIADGDGGARSHTIPSIEDKTIFIKK